MQGFVLPSPDSATFSLEQSHLAVLRSFFALLAVRWPGQPMGLLLCQHWPHGPVSQGPPSQALAELGIARPNSAAQQLHQQWLEGLSSQQAAQYLSLLH